MTLKSPKLMEARRAAGILESALRGHTGDLTLADASARSGLPLRDAESGLHLLVSEYRGHLKATTEGELLFRFPHGFTKPWQTRTRLERALGAVLRGAAGVARFLVRAWIAIVLIAYVVIFLGILIAQMFARSNSDSREGGGFSGSFVGYLLFRVVFDAIFWTFHPFSPFVWTAGSSWSSSQDHRGAFGQRRRKDETPFYEKVNRFFFGPTPAPRDPLEHEKLILAEIRAQRGRIGLADVMRVTGLPRDQADPLMARLMLDYDGTVDVSEEGGLVYRFEAIRRTAADAWSPAPAPVWGRREELPPLTGNSGGVNALIVALNGFNLVMSLYALGAHLTIDNLGLLAGGVPMSELPGTGTAVALGVVPLVFSLALFALPLGRALLRPLKRRRVARQNARRAVLRAILSRVGARGRAPITEAELSRAWQDAAGEAPSSEEITREVAALGGDVDLEAGEGIRYRFPELETEAKALEAEREAASEEEARPGKVIFSSDV
ncbi:hypothetical protein SOCEGT47_051080 [Sorangium cellulosum]|uniref:Uncharacterized protein n=1 Tax=Sorangium cellulosum TaxID=56 RepID=A0A4P2Q5A7_SORCE|nr:hypothetical protein [Sorangium cellulosum]AUX24570.1 hypothetical protein SOCEGT47_051080 [Sorangium cellulosum]